MLAGRCGRHPGATPLRRRGTCRSNGQRPRTASDGSEIELGLHVALAHRRRGPVCRRSDDRDALAALLGDQLEGSSDLLESPRLGSRVATCGLHDGSALGRLGTVDAHALVARGGDQGQVRCASVEAPDARDDHRGARQDALQTIEVVACTACGEDGTSARHDAPANAWGCVLHGASDGWTVDAQRLRLKVRGVCLNPGARGGRQASP